MPGGVGATVLVRVRSAGGSRGQARCRIDILPRGPTPGITCTAGGFLENMARINDVDLACLDDVSGRMHRWPEGQTFIVGHADPRERRPHVLGMLRADVAARYLVREHAIERERIRIASAGAARPLERAAAARARNRRVDVTLLRLRAVPAGERGSEPGQGAG